MTAYRKPEISFPGASAGKSIQLKYEPYEEVMIMKPEIVEETYSSERAANGIEPFDDTKANLSAYAANGMVFTDELPIGNTECEHWDSEENDFERDTYQCGLCCLKFENVKCLTNHHLCCPNRNESNVDGDSFVCRFCGLEILDEQHYLGHTQRCKTVLLDLNKQQNNNNKNGERLKCNQCGFSTSQHSDLRTHSLDHSKLRRFECSVRKAAQLKYEPYEEVMIMKPEIVEETYSSERTANGIETFDDTTANSSAYAVNRTVFINGLPIGNMECEYWDSEENDFERDTYQCDLCCLKFENGKCLTNHHLCCPNRNESNVDGDRFACRFCGLEIWDEQHYLRHTQRCRRALLDLNKQENNDNMNRERLKCNQCGFSTSQHSDLRGHSLCHSKAKRLECSVCKAAFKQRGHVTNHMKVHNRKRKMRFQCEYCDNSYRSRSFLVYHVNVKHLKNEKLKRK